MNARERHDELVPMGTQVSSKGRFRNCDGFGPEWIEHAHGAYVYGDGAELIDWSCGLGALTIGHGWGWGDVVGAPKCFPLPSRAEVHLAERLHDWVPCAEMSRFLKTGSDATSAAVRIARVYTGRDLIVDAGNYHGNQDWSIAAEHEGVPECVRHLTQRIPFNDVGRVEDWLKTRRVAALIMEPVSLITPMPDYLPAVRDLCTKYGTVLIFDEVITGIRMAPGGAQEVYGVTPDLCAIGKGLANGYPISAVCGRRDLMECWSRTHLSGTHFGEPSCMEASLRTMAHLGQMRFWEHQEFIGSSLLRFVRMEIEQAGVGEFVKAAGHPHWWVLQIPDAINQTYVQQCLIAAKVLGSNGSHFVSLAHTEEIMHTTVDAYRVAFACLRTAIDSGDVAAHLTCEPNRTIFRRN